MIIEGKDVRAFVSLARREYETGADTVFCQDRIVKPDDLFFCMGEPDKAVFFHNHPFDYNSYKSYQVRALYEAITLIEKKRIPREEVLFTGWGRDRELIDLGNFINKREIIAYLHHCMKNGDWYYDYSDDFLVWRKGEAFFSTVKVNLLWLSRQMNGKELANKLWTMYAPPYSIKRPDFLMQAMPDALQSQQPSPERNPSSQVVLNKKRSQQSKKKPGQHKPRL